VGLLISGIKSGDIAKGYADAIEKCGILLSQHFPIRPQDKNELPNKLVLKD
jgi:putative membrane protein